jgi:hypothetical protein
VTRPYWLLAGAALIFLVLIGWAATTVLERVVDPPLAPVEPPPVPAAATTAHIRATLFFGSSDGMALVQVRREVPLAGDVAGQGRAVLVAQLQPAPPPYLTVIPPGTALRAFYMSSRGDAFVDLSSHARSAHPGGSLGELLTVQAIVQAVTTNLPSARRVQILIEGQEVETLAGHIDLRRPLTADTSMNRGN